MERKVTVLTNLAGNSHDGAHKAYEDNDVININSTDHPPLAPHHQPNVLSPHSLGPIAEDVWPTLFWGPERLEEVRRKIEHHSWAKELFTTLCREAREVAAAEPLLPIEPIGWRHSFYSPVTSEHLIFDLRSPHQYVDPHDQTVYTGEEYRKAWVLLAHERTYRLMRTLALLYRLTGDKSFATWVVKGLEKAVVMFAQNQFRRGNNTEALYFQPLYDAQILSLLANTCALLQGTPAYPETLHQRVAEGIFLPAMPYQIRFIEKQPYPHNMTCYVDAALLFAGRLLGRADWVERALHHPVSGFYAMLANGLAKDADGNVDGFWLEDTQFYHFYSVCPLLSIYGLLKDAESEVVYRLRRMLLAPAEMADSQLRLPVIGDLGAPKVKKLSTYIHVYEAGAGLLGGEELLATLAGIYSVGSRPRTSLSALVLGPDTVEPAPPKPRSVILPATNMVFLRKVGYQAFLKSGLTPKGHGHHDRLSFGLTAHGQPILTDPGTAGYAERDYTAYCRSALAHNTVLVDDDEKQHIADSYLKASLPQLTVAAGITLKDDKAHLQRRLQLAPPLLLLEDTYSSAASRVFTWAIHPYGAAVVAWPGQPAAESSLPSLPPLPDDGVFRYLTNLRHGTSAGPLCVDWQVTEEIWLRVWVWASKPFVYTLAASPGNPRPDRHTSLLVRTAFNQLTIRAAFEVYMASPTLATYPGECFPLSSPAPAAG
ncbi:MAG TPA: hypothetical protein GXX29_14155 [Firmicutes bacterium]|nr:hypothetical protein [Bacillota bacterium]